MLFNVFLNMQNSQKIEIYVTYFNKNFVRKLGNIVDKIGNANRYITAQDIVYSVGK